MRVSSPDRVIYEATERTPEVTKLMVAEYFASVDDGLMRALRDRPTALERWTSGVRPGMKLATGPQDKDADAFYQKRVPKGAPDYLETVRDHLPVRPDRRRDLPDRDRGAGVVRPHGHAHLPPLAGTPRRRRPPRRAAHRPRPAAGHHVRRRGPGRRASPRSCWRSSACVGYPKTRGNRGVHIYVRIEPEWEFVDVRHAAIGFGRELARRDDGVTMDWWKEERGERIFVDFNQNNRDRTIASAYSLRPIPGAPVSTPMTWDELAGVTDPGEYNLFTVPDRVADGDPWAAIDDTAYSLEPLLQLWEEQGGGRAQLPARLPEDAGRAAAGAAEQEGRRALGRRTATGSAIRDAGSLACVKRLLLVTGSGRSGTSSVAGTLKRMGLHIPQPEGVGGTSATRSATTSHCWSAEFHKEWLEGIGVRTIDTRPNAGGHRDGDGDARARGDAARLGRCRAGVPAGRRRRRGQGDPRVLGLPAVAARGLGDRRRADKPDHAAPPDPGGAIPRLGVPHRPQRRAAACSARPRTSRPG